MSQTDGPSLEEILHLTSLAEVFGGFAHEIAQPLNAMMIASQVMQLKVERSLLSDAEKNFFIQRLGIVTTQVQRAGDLVEALRGFARPSLSSHQPADLEDIMKRILTLMGQQFAVRGVRVEVECANPVSKLRETGLLAERVVVQGLAFARDLITEINKLSSQEQTPYEPRLLIRLSEEEQKTVIQLLWNPSKALVTPEISSHAGLRAATAALIEMGGSLSLEDEGLTIRIPL